MKLSTIIVDDSNINLVLFKELVGRVEDLEPRCFAASEEALQWCAGNPVDIVIVDYMMPAPDGVEFIRRLRAMPGMGDLPVIMITANDQKDVRYAALDVGATDFFTKPVDKREFVARMRNMGILRRGQRLLADRAAQLAEEVAAATATIVERERETIVRLSKAAEYRDPETGGHIQRMAHFSLLIAARLGLSLREQSVLLEAAPMHDIGKVGVPDHILLKPGRLLGKELELMRTHPEIGYQILCDSVSPILETAAVIAISHHEKFDGSGYPRQLKGNDIPILGRIVAVADVFDALTSVRPYKKAWSDDDAKEFLLAQSAKHFDPDCVSAFLSGWTEVLSIRARFAGEGDGVAHALPS